MNDRLDVLDRVARAPVALVIGSVLAGLGPRQQAGVEVGPVVDVVGERLGEVVVGLCEREQQVQPRRQPEVEARELDVRKAAGEGGVAVQVVAGDDRKHRLHVRGARVGGGLELVDPQVGGAEQSHVAVGMGDGRGPIDDRCAVMTLNRVKQPPLAPRAAGAADIDQHGSRCPRRNEPPPASRPTPPARSAPQRPARPAGSPGSE